MHPTNVSHHGIRADQPIVWSSEWEIGIPLIDFQHRRLVEMTENLRQTVLMEQHQNTTKVTKVLKGLISYCSDHFECEQMLMQTVGYGSYDSHLAKHRRFTAQTLQWFDDFQNGALDPKVVMEALMEWLLDHIFHTDITIVQCCQRKGIDYSQFRTVADVIPKEPLRRCSLLTIPIECGVLVFLFPMVILLCWIAFWEGTASLMISGSVVGITVLLCVTLVAYIHQALQARTEKLQLQNARQLADNLLAGEIAKRIAVMDLDDIESLIAHENSPLVMALQDIIGSVRLYLPFIPETILSLVRGNLDEDEDNGDDDEVVGDPTVVEGIPSQVFSASPRSEGSRQISDSASGQFAFSRVRSNATSANGPSHCTAVATQVMSSTTFIGACDSGQVLAPWMEQPISKEKSKDSVVGGGSEKESRSDHLNASFGGGGSGYPATSSSHDHLMGYLNHPVKASLMIQESGSTGSLGYADHPRGPNSKLVKSELERPLSSSYPTRQSPLASLNSPTTNGVLPFQLPPALHHQQHQQQQASGSGTSPRVHHRPRSRSRHSTTSDTAKFKKETTHCSGNSATTVTQAATVKTLTTTWLLKKSVSVLVADIQGFAQMMNMLAPDDLLAIHSAFVGHVEAVSKATKGRFNTLRGDQVVLSWNAANSVGNYAQYACKAAMKLKDVTSKMEELKGYKLAVHIAVGTGNALVGNMGSKSVLSFSVLGPVALFTVALCKLNRFLATDVLICSNTWRNTKEFYVAKMIAPFDILCSAGSPTSKDDVQRPPCEEIDPLDLRQLSDEDGMVFEDVRSPASSWKRGSPTTTAPNANPPTTNFNTPAFWNPNRVRWLSQDPACPEFRQKMFVLQLIQPVAPRQEMDEWMYELNKTSNPYEGYNEAVMQLFYGNFAKGQTSLRKYIESNPTDHLAKTLSELKEPGGPNGKDVRLKMVYGWHLRF